MGLEQFAGLSEIVASVAVVASLIYVARQLRQNTEESLATDAGFGLESRWFNQSDDIEPSGRPSAEPH